MPPKKSKSPSLTMPGNVSPSYPPNLRTVTLIATDEEKEQTSKSMYHDYKCRVATHPGFMGDEKKIQQYISLFDKAAKGKSVLIIGGGMGFGLLPMLCVKRGAKRVVAIDDSHVISICKTIAKDNHFTDEKKLKFIQGKANALPLAELDPSQEKFDLILCDWVSNFLVNDGASMAEVVFARDHLLASGGDILPNAATLHAVGISDYEYHQSTVEWWRNVYGFSMKTMRECVVQEPSAGVVPLHTVVTDTAVVKTIQVADLKGDGNTYSASFDLKVARGSTTLHFVTVYPVIDYYTRDGVGFSMPCGPAEPNGPVLPTSLTLPEYVPCCGGDIVRVDMKHTPVPKTHPPRVSVDLKVAVNSSVGKTEVAKTYMYAEYR